MNCEGLNEWREFFKGANGSIFQVINNAIRVAAKDHPEEFKLRRGEIVETVYSSFFFLHCGHCHNELTQPEKEKQESFKDEPQNGGFKSRSNGNAVVEENGMEAMYDGIRDDANMKTVQESIYSHSEAEALVETIDEEKEDVVEVLRIKEVLCNSHEESEAGLFESLRRLQLMDLSVEILQGTEIGICISALRKHRFKQISQFADRLIRDWKNKTDDYLQSTAAIAESSTPSDSTLSFACEEVGLPAPPLDDINAVFFSQIPMELSKFFDEIDEDKNPQNIVDTVNAKNRSQLTKEVSMPVKEDKHQSMKQGYVPTSPTPVRSKPSDPETAKWKPHVLNLERKMKNGTDSLEIPDKKAKPLDDVTVRAKVKTRKNKLPEGFQQVEKGKKQRLQGPVSKLTTLTNASNSNNEHDLMRPQEQGLNKMIKNGPGVNKNKDKVTMPESSLSDRQENRFMDDAAMQDKFEAAKKKLQIRYQQAEKDRSRRTVQIMELHELPNQGLGRANSQVKQKKNSQRWANRRW